MTGKLQERAGDALLVQLADLADHRRVARTKLLRKRRERIAEPRTALVEHQGCANGADLGNRVMSRFGFRRQEAEKQKTVGRKPRKRQCSDRGRWPRDRVD